MSESANRAATAHDDTAWNFADVWETVARDRPEAEAIVDGDRRLTYADLERRAENVAAHLELSGLRRGSKVAQYLHNCSEYLESVFACFKAGFVPVNTNYRYGDDELRDLWTNADAEAVVFHAEFAERVDRVRRQLPDTVRWLVVGEGLAPDWAVRYDDVAEGPPASRAHAPRARSGDDLLLLYTGGTTGLPKGVMWRQDDLFAILNRTGEVRYRWGPVEEVVPEGLAASTRPTARLLACAPLMHGTGLFTVFSVLSSGGCVVLLPGRRFDARQVLDIIERERVTQMTIIGDAFGKPILHELDTNPDRWDLSSLWLIMSSGMMWSEETKLGLLRHIPRLLAMDMLGSSEAIGVGRARMTADAAAPTASFELGAGARVIDDDGRDVVPGSDTVGRLVLQGRLPLGYYKDPEKTAATFPVIDGRRSSITGDYATVNEDGRIRLLGRGSLCINSGGEKIFPEEVEEALKTHPAVLDTAVVGIPDERLGERVVASVQLRPGASTDSAELLEHLRTHLAAYKAPKQIVFVPEIRRAANGKLDYRWHRQDMLERMSS
jgi:acyl-CoA synthetase (AMP-forming)/AMP-acid ligase II